MFGEMTKRQSSSGLVVLWWWTEQFACLFALGRDLRAAPCMASRDFLEPYEQKTRKWIALCMLQVIFGLFKVLTVFFVLVLTVPSEIQA